MNSIIDKLEEIMRTTEHYIYLCEGQIEKKILEIFIKEFRILVPGKLEVFNVIQDRLKTSYLTAYSKYTHFVLVFDTDTDNSTILKENLRFLQNHLSKDKIIVVPQVRNIEDELVYCCDVKHIWDLTKYHTLKDFKDNVITDNTFGKKLIKHKFNGKLLWSRTPRDKFSFCRNDSNKIKIK